MKAEIFRGRTYGIGMGGKLCQAWYWHIKARNGEIVCQSEGYTRRSSAKRALARFIQAVKEMGQ